MRVNNLLGILIPRHQVTLISQVNTISWEVAQQEIASLEGKYSGIVVVPKPKVDAFRFQLGYLSPLPRHIFATFSKQTMRLIEEQTAKVKYDMVIASEVGGGTGLAYYASKLACVPMVLDCLELQNYLDQTSSQHLRRILTWLKMRSYVTNLLKAFNVCTVPSPQEFRNVMRIAPSKICVKVVPHSIDLNHYRANPTETVAPYSLVYNGSLTYFPNQDAVEWLLQEILPIIRNKDCRVKLKIIGGSGNFDVQTWRSCCDVEFLGELRDVRQAVQQANVSVVPLRYGSGTRMKIIESMALGTPVISTSKGAEGLEVQNGEHLLIADSPADFAEQTIRLMQDPGLGRQLARNARRLVEEKYDSNKVGQDFCNMIEELDHASRRGELSHE